MTEAAQRYRAAVEALNRGDWPRAQALAGPLLREAPDHAGVHFVVGVASLHLAQMPQAMARLQSAVQLNPQRPDYLAQFARGLAMSRMFREALAAAERAMALGPGDPLTLDTLGVVFTQCNRQEKAVDAFRRAIALFPGNPGYHFNLATALIYTGDLQGAEAAYEQCLRLAPTYGKAHLALAQLRRQTAESNHVERLRGLLEQAGSDRMTGMYLHLALAKELEDLGEYGQAFAHLSEGKRAGGEGRNYDIARDRELFEALMAAFPEPLAAGPGCESEEPIFVIGMPRSGTTLVERILSSHPDVLSCGELQNFGVALKRASGSTTRYMLDVDTVQRARDVDPVRLGQAYLDSTRPVTGSKPRFVDKLPHNFMYAGHIARALPKARIIGLRRNPLDTCLGNFRQLFALTSPFFDYSFDLLDTGRYYLLYERLMAHWRQVLPGRILDLDYEALVEDQEAQTRRLLEFCGLDWHEDCLRFERNAAPVATASAVQVRESLHGKAVGRWQRYASELEPLVQLLREGGLQV
jgi:tetratricopeptide (TPR) repeat protein